MSSHRVTLIPGDGIGPEVVAAACRVIEATGVEIEWERHLVGLPALEQGSTEPVPAEVVASVLRNGAALKGPVTTGISGFRSPNLELRQRLGVHTQLRLLRSFAGVARSAPGVDLVVARETTEDLYSGVEFVAGSAASQELTACVARNGGCIPPESGISIKHTSAAAARRMLEFVADWATRNDRRRVTVVHKATVMRATDGLFLEVARDVFAAHTELELDECSVDLVAMQLVRDPTRFDLLATGNLYGDILSDLGAGLIGSVGLAPGANYGDGVAVFEPAHGSAPKHAGHDRANPVAAILCAAMLLRHLGEDQAAALVETATRGVLAGSRVATYEIADGTPSTTTALTDAIAGQITGAGA